MGGNTCEEGPVMVIEVEGQTEGMMQVEAEGGSGGYSQPWLAATGVKCGSNQGDGGPEIGGRMSRKLSRYRVLP